MTLRHALFAAAVLALAPLPAAAQPTAPEKVVPPLLVTVQTSMFLAGSTATAEEETALQQKARAMVYSMGASECAVLAPSITGDCRVSQIRVSTSDPARTLNGIARPGATPVPEGVNVSGSFTLTITPKQ